MSGRTSKTYTKFMQELLDLLDCENLTEFSRATGIPRSTLDPYATGETMPTYEHAKCISLKTKRPLADIFKGFEDNLES